MKRALLASTVLLGAGLVTNPAAAAEGVSLGSGGFFQNAYLSGCEEDAPGGASVQSLGFAGTMPATALAPLGACSRFDGSDGDEHGLIPMTPRFGGFQLAIGLAPSSERPGAGLETPFDQTDALDDESLHDSLVYGTYELEGDDWSVTALAGTSIDSSMELSPGQDGGEQKLYQLGVNITFGNLAVGGVLEYYNNLVSRDATDLDRWVAGAGIAYTMDAWTIGAHYVRLDQEGDGSAVDEFQQDRISLTGNYEVGPGINIDGALGYTWIDGDPESGISDETEADDRSALEIGLGTNFTF